MLFRKEFGCNPGEYARTKVPIPLFIPYGVKFKEIRKENHSMETVQSVFVQLMRKPGRKAIIKEESKQKTTFPIVKKWDAMCGES